MLNRAETPVAGSPLLRVLNDKQRDWAPLQTRLHAKLAEADVDGRWVTGDERDAVCALIARLAQRHALGVDTVCMAIALYDHTLATANVPLKYARVCGLACVFTAAKVCEEHVRLQWLLDAADAPYSRDEIVRMERQVLHRCALDVHLPSAHRFLQALVGMHAEHNANVQRYIELTARPLLVAALCRHSTALTHAPSTLAIACIGQALLARARHHQRLGRAGRKRRRRLVSRCSSDAPPTVDGGARAGETSRRRTPDADGKDDVDWTPALRLLYAESG